MLIIENILSGVLILFVLIVFFIGKWAGFINVQNWWAIIFWIPAISSFGNVLKEIRLKKGFSFSLISGISGILFPIAISIGFFIGPNWILYAPVFIIISGLILIQTGFIDSKEPIGEFFQNVQPWAISIGLSVVTIGIIFLAPALFPDLSFNQMSHLFGLSFIICSIGGFYFVFRRIMANKNSSLVILINLFFAQLLLFMGILIFIKRSFDIVEGIIFILLFLFLAIFLIKKNANPKNLP